MSARRILLAAATVTAVGFGAFLGPGAYASPSPAPDTEEGAPAEPEVVDGVPDEVALWFRTEARAVLESQATSQLDLTPDQREDLTLGLVRIVSTWSPGYVDGSDLEPPTAQAQEWLSPVFLDDDGVGVLRAVLADDGSIQLESLTAAATLADSLIDLPAEAPVVHDGPLDAWFTVDGGEIRPLDDTARDSLAGTLPVDVYQPLVAERYMTDDFPDMTAETGPTWVPAAWAGGAMTLLLAWAAVVVWLRRDGEIRRDGGA